MKQGKKRIIIGVIALLIMLIPTIVDYFESIVKPITFFEFKENIDNGEKMIVYFDFAKSKTKKTTFSNLRKFQKISGREYYFVNIDSLTNNDKLEVNKLNPHILSGSAFVFINDKKIIEVRRGSYSPTDIEKLDNKYFKNYQEDLYYKVPANSKEFIERADKEELTMVVFGRTSCSNCEDYKPVFNKIAADYELDIYYFDSDYYDRKEYNKVINNNYIIPGYSNTITNGANYATCTRDGKSALLANGFSTPLTLFISNGKVVDCILGTASLNQVKESVEFYEIKERE